MGVEKEDIVFKKIFTTAWTMLLFACCQVALAAPTISVVATPSNPVAPASVMLSISVAPDTDPVTVTQVEYFNGTTSLGTVLQAPFTLTLDNLAAGTYPIVVRATTTDINYPIVQSVPLAVTVGLAPGSASAYFIHTDQINTPRGITNGSGSLVWRWDSDPFGNDSANEQPAGQSAFKNNLRFSGQYFDRESNLYYNYFRDYDPALGRYIQSDPIGLNGGINTYGYVLGNPVGNYDPLGLAIKCKTILKLPGYDVQSCDGDKRTAPSEQDARDAKRMSDKELDKACKKNNYRNAHHMKDDLGLDSKSDIFADKNGNMYSGPRQGTGLPQYLYMNTMGL